jgi:hypothetical protein
MGTNGAIARKAGQDYLARSRRSGGLTLSTTTFVFVTPREFAAKRAWVRRRQARTQFKDVACLDVDDLYDWLEAVPSVHDWFSRECGWAVEGLESLESFWARWSRVTRPELSADVVNAGRIDEEARLRSWLRGSPELTTVSGSSAEEVSAFLVASLFRGNNLEFQRDLQRGLVVDRASAWTVGVGARQPMILVTTEVDVDFTQAVGAGHHVLVASGPRPTATDLDLPTPRPSAIVDALIALGVTRERSHLFAAVSRGGLEMLRRELAPPGAVRDPAWAVGPEVNKLIPALFAGAWNDENPADRAVIEQLNGTAYETTVAALTGWIHSDEPPVRRVGQFWVVSARPHTWRLLSRQMNSTHIARLIDVIQATVGSHDPRLDLPPERRWRAALDGQTRDCSEILLRNLADAVALLAIHTVDVPGLSAVARADALVRTLLRTATEADDGLGWASIRDSLPSLAEASPRVFLEELQRAFADVRAPISSLFEGQDDLMLGGYIDDHQLRFAIELLSFPVESAAMAVRQLARLASIDPGSSRGSQRLQGLWAWFCPLAPRTEAPDALRASSLEWIRNNFPELAWELLTALLPPAVSSMGYPHEAHFRSWDTSSWRIRSPAERIFGFTYVLEQAIEVAGVDPVRLLKLTAAMQRFPIYAFDRMTLRLEAIDPDTLDLESRLALVGEIRSVVSMHRSFSDSPWAMPRDRVDRLAAIGDSLSPDDAELRFLWLFEDHPPLDVGWQSYPEELTAKRQSAAGQITTELGLDGLERVARRCKQPGALGQAASELDLDETWFLQRLGSADRTVSALAQGWALQRVTRDGNDWAFLRLRSSGIEDAARADLLAVMPTSNATLDAVDELDAAATDRFWSQAILPKPEDRHACLRVATALVERGAPWNAVGYLGLWLHGVRSPEEARLVTAILLVAAKEQIPKRFDFGMSSYYVSRLLDALETTGTVDDEQLAMLELQLIPILIVSERGHPALDRTLSRDPRLFVQLVEMMDLSEEQQEGGEATVAMERRSFASQVLSDWHGAPGLSAEGTLDPAVLSKWIRDVRGGHEDSGYLSICDYELGQLFARIPGEVEGPWPQTGVGEAIEQIDTDALEWGTRDGIVNSRGMYTRGAIQGGVQERGYAGKYRGWRDAAFQRGWVRTASILARVVSTYEADAVHQDTQAELLQDLGF